MLLAHNAATRITPAANGTSHVAPHTKTAPQARVSEAKRTVNATVAMRSMITPAHHYTAR